MAEAKKKKKRRKKNPEPVTAALANPSRRRRRRKKNPAPRRRRRRNPEGRAGRLLSIAQFPKGQSILMAMLADLVIGFAVKRASTWTGDAWGTGMFGQAATSPYAGQGWSFRLYAAAGLALMLGARMVRGWRGEEAAREFSHAGWTQLARRFMYTEVIARNQWAQDTFGQVAQVVDTSDGTRWIETPEGGWYAMQGRLVPETAMGSRLVPETAMGRYHGLRPARPVDRLDNVGNQATFPGRDMGVPAGDEDVYRRAWSANMLS